MNVLVFGAAGYVGSFTRDAIVAAYPTSKLFDIRPIPGAGERGIVGDVNDDEAVRNALAGMNAVVYLAMGTGQLGNPRTCGDIDQAFNVNVRGWYRVLYHGLRAGVRRFVYASTMSVYHGIRSLPQPVNEDTPANSWEAYGFSKRVGEFISQAAVQECPDATIVNLRLVHPRSDEDWANDKNDPRWHRVYPLPPNDTRRLFLAALACDKPGCHIVQTCTDLEGKHMPIDRATALLGWKPEVR